MSDAVHTVHELLIRDHGGRENHDSAQLLISAKLAELLVSEAPISAQAVTALSSLLPAKRAAGEPEYDLSRLSEKEFAELDRLTGIAAGIAPSKPDKPRRYQRRSPREHEAQALALLLDAL